MSMMQQPWQAWTNKGVHLDGNSNCVFTLMMDETGYTFYIDGVEDGKITKHLTACPEFILISTEVKGYRYEDHKPVQDAYDNQGDTFLVDYVRVFERK